MPGPNTSSAISGHLADVGRANDSPIHVINILEEARIGGPQVSTILLARHLAGPGCKVTVYTAASHSEDLSHRLIGQGTSVRTIPLMRMKRGLRDQLVYVASTPATIWRYWRMFAKDRPDVVHVNSAAQWRPAFAAWLRGLPCVWTLNDTKMPAAVKLFFEKLAFRFADGFICVAEKVVAEYRLPAGDTRLVEVIPAPCDVEKLQSTPASPDPEINATPGIRIANVGHLNPDKDIETLIRTAAIIGQRLGRKVTFFQVGGTFADQARYVARITDYHRANPQANIRFLGERSNVAGILAACHFYFCSSCSEASPIAVWEALATGLPVVATEVGDLASYNRECDFGFVRPVADADGLADALCELVNNGGWMKAKVRKRIRRFAQDTFSPDAIAASHLDFYRRAILRKRRMMKPGPK